jgi:NitT/TauT family transport system substrate-binding protein
MSFARFLSSLMIAMVLALPAKADGVLTRVGIIPVLGVSPILVVDKEGWAKDAGLDLHFTTFESGPLMMQALAAGAVDIYVAGVSPLGVARSKGIDINVLTATAVEEMTMAAGPKLAPYFDAASGAEAFKHYHLATGKAARLATQPPGSVPHTTLIYWLTQMIKAAPEDYEIVPMGIDATQQALLSGAVDGATIREPTDTIVRQRDPRIKIIALGADMFPHQPGTVVAVAGGFLAKNPAAVQKLVDALVKADGLIKQDPHHVAPEIEAFLGKGIIDAATIEQALISPATKFIADPRTIIDSTAKMQSFQVSIGTLDKDVALDGLFDPSYYLRAIEHH